MGHPYCAQESTHPRLQAIGRQTENGSESHVERSHATRHQGGSRPPGAPEEPDHGVYLMAGSDDDVIEPTSQTGVAGGHIALTTQSSTTQDDGGAGDNSEGERTPPSLPTYLRQSLINDAVFPTVSPWIPSLTISLPGHANNGRQDQFICHIDLT